MKALTATAMIIAFLTTSAIAQQTERQTTRRSDAEKKEDAEVDKAYKAVTGGVPAPAAPKKDPWQTVRPVAADKPKR
jgi:hypothetical protein